MNNVDAYIVNNITTNEVDDRPIVMQSSVEWRPISDVSLPTVVDKMRV